VLTSPTVMFSAAGMMLVLAWCRACRGRCSCLAAVLGFVGWR
jgi:hypothetical protein